MDKFYWSSVGSCSKNGDRMKAKRGESTIVLNYALQHQLKVCLMNINSFSTSTFYRFGRNFSIINDHFYLKDFQSVLFRNFVSLPLRAGKIILIHISFKPGNYYAARAHECHSLKCRRNCVCV